MGEKRYNVYSLKGISTKAKNLLPVVLDEMGYQGRYSMEIEKEYLSINSVFPVVEKAFLTAEERAQGEEGYLIRLQKKSYSELWVSKKEAPSLNDAYRIALAAAENGYPIDRDPEFAVGSVDGEYHDEWEFSFSK